MIPRPTPNDVLTTIARWWGVDAQTLCAKDTNRLHDARAVASFILHERCGLSFPEASTAMRRDSHTSALHMHKRARQIIDAEIERLTAELQEI